MPLPVELVREIIASVLECCSQDSSDAFSLDVSQNLPTGKKPDWSLIHSLSVASKTYRTLALEAWFRVLVSRSPSDILFLQTNFPEIRNSWTRELQCVPPWVEVDFTGQELEATVSEAWDLVGFRRLHTIRLHCFLMSCRKFPFLNVPSSVVELELLDLGWPTPYVVQAISETFRGIRTLRLDLHSVWCSLCNTCSRVGLVEPVPPKLVYKEGLGLPIHYARMLSPMQHLHTVSITVPYSLGKNIHINGKDPTEELWSGECDDCVGVMYVDTDFRERWMARKKGTPLRNSTGKDERSYIKPPALEIVEWIFRQSSHSADDWDEADVADDAPDDSDNEE
ncbi:hypothetical protein DFH07DRAFT_315850 [Mycena maculata]|uniref:Uncharacterized protein n=1 Tax=Mycena maculata TaxID=230809 RepID=A0AAD7MIL0_9AGAR|nr:hypothetical protein DFH07DRAFT_315850 [Mycena maculata]